MKKKFLILLIVAIILLIELVWYFKLNRGSYITDYEWLYDEAIQYIEDEIRTESNYENQEDFQVFTDYKGFGIQENDTKKYAYMWILEEEYYVENGKLQTGSGSSMPYKFTFENNQVIDYEIPKDGSYYVSSIKKMFPRGVASKILYFNMDNSKLDTKVKEHYAYLENEENAKKNVFSTQDEKLRLFLTDISYFNALKDKIYEKDISETEFYNGIKLDIATYLVTYANIDEINNLQFKKSEINTAIKEFLNEDVTDIIESEVSFLKYDSNIDSYIYKDAGDGVHSAYIVKIENQSYLNGIHEITYLYAYPSEGDLLDENIGDYDCFRNTVKLKLNENYRYSEYQLMDADLMESSLVGKIKDFEE